MPIPLVAFPCGSASARSVFFFLYANAADRLTEVVVFPTPPFWFTTAITFAMCERPFIIYCTYYFSTFILNSKEKFKKVFENIKYTCKKLNILLANNNPCNKKTTNVSRETFVVCKFKGVKMFHVKHFLN